MVGGCTGAPRELTTITATVGGSASGNYTVTNTPGLLTINPVALTVTVTSASKSYGAALPTFSTGSVTGLVNGDTVRNQHHDQPLHYGDGSVGGRRGGAGGAYPITAIIGGSASGNYT